MAAPDDFTRLAEALAGEVGARVAAPRWDHTEDAIAYFRILTEKYPNLGDALVEMMEPLAPRVLADAGVVRRAILDDPAADRLEAAYRAALRELSSLAAVFNVGSRIHDEISDEISSLMAAALVAEEAWESKRAARPRRCGVPPTRRN